MKNFKFSENHIIVISMMAWMNIEHLSLSQNNLNNGKNISFQMIEWSIVLKKNSSFYL
jgi:hypothetical protein